MAHAPLATAARTRRTQEERSAETRARLLEATIESLGEVGYASTTTTGVCERAGVSRGMIRISIGLEDAQDLIEDLEQALG